MSFGNGFYNQQIAAQKSAFERQRAALQGIGGLFQPRSPSLAEAFAQGRAMTEGRKPKPDTILDELQQEVDQWLENTI